MKTPVLDEDGNMMFCNAVSTLGGSAQWNPFTNPNDYYGGSDWTEYVSSEE